MCNEFRTLTFAHHFVISAQHTYQTNKHTIKIIRLHIKLFLWRTNHNSIKTTHFSSHQALKSNHPLKMVRLQNKTLSFHTKSKRRNSDHISHQNKRPSPSSLRNNTTIFFKPERLVDNLKRNTFILEHAVNTCILRNRTDSWVYSRSLHFRLLI